MDGTVWSWGSNSSSGQLGDGTTVSRSVPGQVTELENVSAIAAGVDQSLALRSDKQVRLWGRNDSQMGDGTTLPRSTPVPVVSLFSPLP